MKLEDFVIVSTNPGKIKEINSILGTDHQTSKLEIDEIQSLDLDEVITKKAKEAYRQIKKPVLVTDVSLEIEGLNGLPGTFVKFFLNTLGVEKTAKLAGKNAKTTVTDAVAIYDGKTLKIFKGQVSGKVITKKRGENGFGFDFVFVPDGYTQTWSQMPEEIKNKISHRARALRKLKTYLSHS